MPKDFQPVIRQNSRAGCAKCKERRIKCDQARPVCQNCSIRRYTCPGYPTVLGWKQFDGRSKSSQEGCSIIKSKDLPFRSLVDSVKRDADQNNHELQYSSVQSHGVEYPSFQEIYRFGIDNGLPDKAPLENNNFMTLSRTTTTRLTHSLISIHDRQTILLWHYFRSVCVINSCCDTSIDPLRSITYNLMSSSRLIYFCILSMSAAHLQQVDPQWSLDSAEYLSETVSALRKQLDKVVTGAPATTVTRQTVEQTLLGVILLGMSTSWHGTSGLGLEHIQGSRALFHRYIYSTSDGVTPSEWPNLSFYLGLQAYWESTASFLVDQDIDQLDTLHRACISLPVETNRVHPWTGVSSTLWVLLAKVGCLVRKRRTLLLKGQYSHLEGDTKDFRDSFKSLNQQAATLEDQILTYNTPDISCFEVTQDSQTLINHLELIAQCCKLAALLELYRAFGLSCNVGAALGPFLAAHGVLLNDRAVREDLTIFDVCRILCLGILNILHSIPKDSNTKCLHPTFFLVAGSVLSEGLIGSSAPRQTSGPLSFWRDFVQERTTYLEGAINLDGVRRIKTILDRVWDCNDLVESPTMNSANSDTIGLVHWIDIMEAHELEFLL